MNKEEVKIQFSATSTGLDEIYKKIKEIQKAPNVKLDDKLLGQLKDLETKVPALIEKIKGTMANENFSIVDVQVLDNEFKQLMKIVDSTITNLGKANLPSAIHDQIEKAKQEITRAQSELASINRKIASREKKLDSSSASGLDDATASRVSKTQGATFELGAQSFANDFNSYVKAYRELEKQGKLTTQMQEDFRINTELLAPEFKKVEDAIRLEIDTLRAQATAKQQAINNGNQYIQNLKQQAASNSSLSEKEKQVAKAVVDASNLATKTRTAERNAIDAAVAKTQEDTQAKNTNTKAQEKNTGTLAKAAKQVFTYGTVLSAFRRIYSTVIRTVTEMDKALTGMAVVTNMSREQAKELTGEFQRLANATGKTTTEIANMATKFYQQGKSTTQVLKLTEAAAKAATIAGIDGSQSIDLLTNAMNGFQISASKAMEVSDKFAALAASAATDYEELATALSKVAAQANLAGMSMDFTLGLLTKGIEVTREAPETIGTALKTVIARMRELTDYGATLEDGIDVNRVAKALDNIGVSLMDTNGQFRDLELVLTEVGKKWDTLNKNQQANVAVALAGTRQQSRLIAMMQDFDRTLELVDIAANSYGATLAQSEKYMGGLEAAQNRLTTSTQGLINSLVDSEVIIGLVEFMTGLVNTANVLLNEWHLIVPIMVVAGLMLTNMLATKMAEVNLKRQDRIEEEKANLKKEEARVKELLSAKRQQLQDAISLKNQQKQLLLEKKKTLEDIKQEKSAKKQSVYNNETLSETQKEAQLAKIDAEYADDIAKAKAEVKAQQKEYNAAVQIEREARLELNKAEGERLQYNAKITQLQMMQNSQAGILGGLFNAILIPLRAIQTIGTVINTVQTIFNALKAKEIGLHKKNTAEIAKEGVAKKISAGWGMAGSASAIPYVGWVIAIGIIAAVIGMMIAAAVQSGKTGDKTEDAIAKTREELNQLQADLYNLDSARQNVAKLGDEFESLSNKIVKTTEDLERMEEIAQQINDQAGRTVVDTSETAEKQLKQIRMYNIQQEAEIRSKRNEINETLGEGYDKSKNKDQYLNTMKTDSAFVNSIRSVGIGSLAGLDKASAQTKDTILDLLVENVDNGEYFSKDGLDTAKFEDYITTALQGTEVGGYAGLISELNSLEESGSMTDYANMLDKLSASGSDATKQLIEGLKKSNPMFAAVADMGTETARKFDEIGFTSDELNTVWDKLKKSSKILGKDAGKALSDMTKQIYEAVDANGKLLYDMDNDGVISDLEARQAMYKQLVADQLEAGKAAQAIVDGTDKESKAAKEYQAALQGINDTQILIDEKQKEIDAENAEKNADEEDLEELQSEMDELTGQYADYEEQVEAVQDAATNCYASINELREILGITSAKDITEEFTKLASTMERVSKITDIASMSLAEQMELLTDYPELLAAVERGYLTAAEAAGLYGEKMSSSLDEIQANKSNYALLYSKDGGAQVTSDQFGEFANIFEDSETGKQQREAFLSMGTLSEDDPWVKEMLAKYQDYGFNTKHEMLQYLQGVKADVEEFNRQDYLDTALSNGDYTAIMSTEDKEAWRDATDVDKQRRNRLEAIDEELEYLEEGSDEYLAIIQERDRLLLEELTANNSKIEEIQEKTKKILAIDVNDPQFSFLRGTTLAADGSISELIKYENGVAKLDYDILNSLNLTEEQTNSLKAYISTVISSLNGLAEEQKDITEQTREDQETLAQSIIDSEAKILEAQIENLEKRKEAYEKYFEEIDALEEETERTATMEDLARQISALSGGSDAATNSLRKELMSQMEDLRKEEEQARKEAARDALIESIDSEIDATNERLDKVNDSLNTIINLLSNGQFTVDANGNLILDENAKPFSTGGLVDYTGPAIVHGSPSSPEAFLSAQDTKNMQLLFAALNDIMTKSATVNGNADIGGGANNITVENINISTNELNNNQDFRTAGQIFAEEFGKAIKQRGLNINVKK